MNNHTEILRIARAGNTARAMQLFVERGLDKIKDKHQLLTLKGRLLRDQANLCDGPERIELYTRAAQAYLAAFELEGTTYPLINAATLSLMSGDLNRSREFARQVAEMIKADPNEGETVYWREATRAEALLLLGDIDAAKTAVADAIALQPLAHEDQAATIGQFERILAAQNQEAGWLDDYRPPCSLHFSGVIDLEEDDPYLCDQVRSLVNRKKPGYAFGALAAGADILIAEAIINCGAQLHVVLPDSLKAFRKTSVQAYGANWTARFDALIDQAAAVEWIPVQFYEETTPLQRRIDFANLVAMGLCQYRADNLRSHANAVTVAVPEDPERRYITCWRNSKRPLDIIKARRAGERKANQSNIAPLDLSSALLLKDCETADVGGLARTHSLKIVPSEKNVLFLGQAQDTLLFAKKCLEQKPNNRVFLVIGPAQGETANQLLLDILYLLSSVDHHAQIIMDRHTALISKMLTPDLRIEEGGEISSLVGPISLWSGQY